MSYLYKKEMRMKGRKLGEGSRGSGCGGGGGLYFPPTECGMWLGGVGL